jgi:predicted ATP-binding protein involved in virulence
MNCNRGELSDFLEFEGVIKMKIKKIYLENFRCFENEKIDLPENLLVLVGNNGSGKTAILDALAVALGGFLGGFDGVKSREILTDEVRLQHYERGSVIDSQPQYPLRVTCEAIIQDHPYTWTRALNKEGGRTTRNEAKAIMKYAEKVQKEVRQGNDQIVLPIISYYGTGRLWVQKKQKTEETLARLQSRFLGYADCLDPASNEKLMTKWFEKMTLIHFQEGKEPAELRAVKDVLKYCLRNIDGNETNNREADILFSAKTAELEITFMNGNGNKERLPFRMLSDGYRNTLGMIADIAYRMAVLNPQLLENVTRKAPGVVLIDEIDLHLHPKWQRHIIADLRAIFPQVQFIVTTHSPNILTTIEKENAIIIDDCGIVEKTPYTYGRDINSILYDLMEVKLRPNDVQMQIDKFYELLEKEDFQQAEEKLNELSQLMGENDSEIVRAKTMLNFERL